MKSKLLSSLEINANKVYFTQAEVLSSGIKILAAEEVLISELEKLKEQYNIHKTRLITALPRHQIFLKRIKSLLLTSKIIALVKE